MTTKKENKIIKRITSVVVGSALLIVGITLVLIQWGHVVAFFKGTIGMVMAIAGLLVLLLIKD